MVVGWKLFAQKTAVSPLHHLGDVLAWALCRGRCLTFADLNHSLSLHVDKGTGVSARRSEGT